MKQLIRLITTLASFLAAPLWGEPVQLYRLDADSPTLDKAASALIVGAAEEFKITVDVTALDKGPEALSFALPGGSRVVAEREIFTVERRYLSWSGRIIGEGGFSGRIHVLDHGDRVSGTLRLGVDQYQFFTDSSGKHRLVRVVRDTDVCALEPGRSARAESFELEFARSGVENRDLQEDTWGHDATDAPASDSSDVTSKSLTTLDVLAIYPSAMSGTEQTQLVTFVDNSIAKANDIFVRSNAPVRYELMALRKLVGPGQPPSTGLIGGLDWMNTDPQELQDLRDEYAADMVALFVPMNYSMDPEGACGIANLPVAGVDFEERAYTVHRQGCGLEDYTFAHELGHNIGMRHRENEDTDDEHAHPYGRGHLLTFTPWRENANGTLATDVPGSFVVGYHFQPLIDGWVTALGGYFNGTKFVRMWDRSTLGVIGQATVTSQNQWEYVDLSSPRKVEAGKGYTVAVYINGTGGSFYSNIVPFPQVYGKNGTNYIKIDGSTVASTATNPNAIPTDTRTDVMYGQVDIKFAPKTDEVASVMDCDPDYDGNGDETTEVCRRAPVFSDPQVFYLGFTSGTPTHNNGQVARDEAPDYSRFRVNGAPNCQDDTLSTEVNTKLSIPKGVILGNDSDPDGDSLRLASYDFTTAQGGMNDTGHAGGFNYMPPEDFSGLDWFFYTVSDRIPGNPAGQTDTCVVYVNVVGSEEEMGETGSVSNLTHSGQTVILSRSYSNPVVIAQTPSRNGGDTLVVRITNVQNDRFTFYLDEAPDRDGPHTTETVSFLVVEAGAWQLPDGSTLRAGKLQVSSTVGRSVANQWTTVNFGGSFSSTPVVLSQVQSNNDPSWVKTRHLSVSLSSVQLALEKEEASPLSHATEDVGWIAMEPGSGNWNGHGYRAGRTPNAVTHSWYTLPFGSSLTSPRFFAAMSTYDGADNAALRYTGLTSTGAQILVEEDTTSDSETGHTTEVVDYLVLSGSGLLTATGQ